MYTYMAEHLVQLRGIIQTAVSGKNMDLKYVRHGNSVVFGPPDADGIRHAALSEEAGFPDLVAESAANPQNVDAGKIIFVPPALLYITETSGFDGRVGSESVSKEETAQVLRAQYPDLTVTM